LRGAVVARPQSGVAESWEQSMCTRKIVRSYCLLGGVAALVAASALLEQGNAADVMLSETSCAALNGRTIDHAPIGLPSGAAKIASTIMMQAALAGTSPQGQPTPAAPAFCKVLGSIAPIDPAAPPIKFEINLPAAWNGKALQYGGGGFNGVLITGLAPLRDAPPNVATPLAQGYVTLGTDSGHDVTALPEILAFALNEEALVNYAYASYKKVHDVASEVARAAYGQNLTRFYFFGGSEGGREALMMAQRFPQDYDGIVSVVPPIAPTGLLARHTHVGLLQRNDGWLSPEKVMTLQKGVLAACDGLDGLKDGVISNIQACNGAFNPTALRCEAGQNTGNGCFSDAEIAVIKAMHDPYELGFALANGMTSYPGWGFGSETQLGGMKELLTGPKPPAIPPLSMSEQGQGWFFGDAAVRYLFTRDTKFDPSKFSPEAFAPRMREVSELLDVSNPDLSAFRQKGGRLIMRSNLADYIVGPFATMDYYKAVVNLMGNDAVDQFVRFYVSPGSVHSGVALSGIDGTPVPYQADLLSVLDAWVDRGQLPPRDKLTQTLHAKEAPFPVVASRPMCAYPTYPHYVAEENPKTAESYECRKP
jgi:hypothetical protein